MSTLILNKKARYNYEFNEFYNAGIVLLGSEVKGIRNGNASLTDAFCYITPTNEIFIKNFSITAGKNSFQHDPLSDKKLLLNKNEILKIKSKLQKNYTIIPLSIILSNGRIKVEIAIARGKKEFDKRNTIKQRDIERDLELI
jgi:SsrA-binding protein